MSLASPRQIEETLIREVLGWPVVDGPGAAASYPAAFWSSSGRCFMLQRRPDAAPRRFSPTRCLWDCLEVGNAVADDGFALRLARPVWEGNVRVVAELGSKEVVVEARSLPWTLSAAIYQAASEGLS